MAWLVGVYLRETRRVNKDGSVVRTCSWRKTSGTADQQDGSPRTIMMTA